MLIFNFELTTKQINDLLVAQFRVQDDADQEEPTQRPIGFGRVPASSQIKTRGWQEERDEAVG